MNDRTDIIDQLAAAVVDRLGRQIPIDVDLWGTAEVAAYLKLASKVVSERIVTLPGFPQAIRLPCKGGGRGHPRWKAIEVIAWVEKHQERRAA